MNKNSEKLVPQSIILWSIVRASDQWDFSEFVPAMVNICCSSYAESRGDLSVGDWLGLDTGVAASFTSGASGGTQLDDPSALPCVQIF
jgi:hypothetical protein